MVSVKLQYLYRVRTEGFLLPFFIYNKLFFTMSAKKHDFL